MSQKRDRDRLRDAFQELRVIGYFARANERDGWKTIPTDVLRRDGKIVFWHANETPVAFNPDGDLVKVLHLQHRTRDSDEILRVLGQYGLNPRVEGRAGEESVVVLPHEEVAHA